MKFPRFLIHLGHAWTLWRCPGEFLREIWLCRDGVRCRALQFILQGGLLGETLKMCSKGHLGCVYTTDRMSREKLTMGDAGDTKTA